MADIMRILSRDAFAAVLGQARSDTARRDPASWSVLRQIAGQLEFMAAATADGRVPTAAERRRTTLGPLAARNLEDSDPEYADTLEELDYTFIRYPLLPPGPPVRRRGVLQVWSGRAAFAKVELELGVPKAIANTGREFPPSGPPAGVPHFQIVWDGVCAHVQAIGGPKITVQGRAVWTAELANRTWMAAGATDFRFLVEDRTPPRTPAAPTAASRAALAELSRRCDAGNLYAIVDAARSRRALEVVEESVDAYASLYDGEQGRAFDDIAPYLVHLRGDSWLLERLVIEGWGDAWGVFLTSDAGFAAVRRHFRQFLMVHSEGEPQRLFFRFYDPRVMTTFAAVMTPEQRAEFMKDVTALWYEDGDRGLRRVDP